MGTRTRRRAAARRHWKRIAVLLALLPIAGLWGYSIVRSAGQILAPLDDPGARPAPVLAAATGPAPSPEVAEPAASAAASAAAAAAADVAPAVPLPGADGIRAAVGDDDADAVPELHRTADMLPLFAEYLREADAAQALELVETLAEFLPAGR